jgi:D-arabinose 1-dehydrogenase-like Zn-dependent alcohol dehydrogenase
MYNTKAYAASSNSSPLAATTIRRREPADKDVQLEILFCGVCHSDLHQVRNEAHALGAHTVVFTTSENKREDALRLGADEVVLSRDRSQMQKHAMSFDFILDTIAADHDLNAYLQLLKQDGNLTLIGIPEKPLAVAPFSLIRTAQSVGLAHTVVATFSSKICDLSQLFERCGTLSHWQPYCI